MRDDSVCQVRFVPPGEAEGALRQAYDAVAGAGGRVHHLYQAMALSPAAIEPADRLYKALLRDPSSPLEPWLRELVATQVAILCGCDYASANHGENFHDFYGDRVASQALLVAIRQRRWRDQVNDRRLAAILDFNERLAVDPEAVDAGHVEMLRTAGLGDDEIVHVVQIGASFAYWARVINGLGIALGDEPIGLAAKQPG